MSWALLLSLGLLSLAMRGAGHLALGDRILGDAAEQRLHLITLALLGAVIATQAFTSEGSLTIDARAAGMTAAMIAALAGGPLLAIFAVATLVTAVARAAGVA